MGAAVLRWFDAAEKALTRGVAFADLSFDAVQQALAGLRDASARDRDRARERLDESIDELESRRASGAGS
jgi:hypothetical protein